MEGLSDQSSFAAPSADEDRSGGDREDLLRPPAIPTPATKDLDVPRPVPDVAISPSSVWRILHKLGFNRLPTSQRYKRTQTREVLRKQRSGHQLQVDVKFVKSLGHIGKKKRYYQHAAIGDCTQQLVHTKFMPVEFVVEFHVYVTSR
ncbi:MULTISPECIES: hypothetical protein [Rhodococcus]|uniref:hypothetical protein n=1 Tax=Rhodococcus TaxID=1827 RepID=UPI0011614718|nr:MULTISPECIES: hypothetical protein [Rhodococcus]MCZ4546184.1 hypothetical protein [Rhodococcus qingshengii]UGQ53331.1 hypothetical protein LRL17_06295 [Rhodococcus qingshengii]